AQANSRHGSDLRGNPGGAGQNGDAPREMEPGAASRSYQGLDCTVPRRGGRARRRSGGRKGTGAGGGVAKDGEGFTGGDPDISQGLKQAWSDHENWPAGLRQQAAPFADKRIWEFIGARDAVWGAIRRMRPSVRR